MTAWLLRHSPIGRLVDQPNSRSSHSIPTPRGGGLSIVAVTTASLGFLYASGLLIAPLAAALIVGGLCVAAVGFWDDVRSAPIFVRIIVHFGAAALAVYCLGRTSDVGAIGRVFNILAIAWFLNLFNFMDGIDGLAASEAVFVLGGGAALGMLAGSSMDHVGPPLAAAAACLGFIRWNWPRAVIFMGDVGSGYLGYAIAVIAISSAQTSALNIYAWIILAGVFLVDASVTLGMRSLRGERIYEAHRTHAYQRLALRWGSHSRVTLAVNILNLVWLLPCAGFAVKFPGAALEICIMALAPLVLCAFLIGSGRPE